MKFTRSKIYRIFSILALLSVMGLIFFLSAQNGEESSQTSGFIGNLLASIFKGDVAQDVLRTFAHFTEYAVLGFLMYNVLYSFNVGFAPLIGVVLSFIYALSDEIHQIFVPERAFQISDLTVDLGGIILGTTVIFLLFTIATKISLKKKKGESL